MLGLIKLFRSQGYRVVFASPADKSEHRFDLSSWGIEEHAILLNCSSFDDYIIELQPDIVLFDRFMMEEQFGWRVAKSCPQAMRILDTEDLHFLRQARHTAYKAKRPVTDSDLKQEPALREIASIYRCDLSLIISKPELKLLSEKFAVPDALVIECPLLLEPQLNFTHQQLSNFEDRNHFVTIGNFRHAPNWDAVLFLKQEIWPLIRKALPTSELHIYGAYPPPKATQLHNDKEGFLVKGWAKNASEILAQAKVCLAPLRFGAGLKGKLVEAMHCGTPNVTTPIGAEGLAENTAWPGFICSDASEIAEKAIELHQQPKLWHQFQQAGFQLVEQKFNHELIAEHLMQRVDAIKTKLESHRLANFTGLMLQHHQHKSTQYMSQWIEAKSRLKSV